MISAGREHSCGSLPFVLIFFLSCYVSSWLPSPQSKPPNSVFWGPCTELLTCALYHLSSKFNSFIHLSTHLLTFPWVFTYVHVESSLSEHIHTCMGLHSRKGPRIEILDSVAIVATQQMRPGARHLLNLLTYASDTYRLVMSKIILYLWKFSFSMPWYFECNWLK